MNSPQSNYLNVGASSETQTSVPELPIYVDSTMLTCFRSCPRKLYNEFILGRRPAGLSIDLHAGGCFALGTETIYKRLWLTDCSLAEALAFGAGVFFDAWGDVEPPPHKRSPKTKDRVWAAIETYVATYGGKTDHVTPYIDASGRPTFEYTFAIPLEPAIDASATTFIASPLERTSAREKFFPLHPVHDTPFLYSGRFDLLGTYLGRPCVRDEKTTTSIGQQWANQWDLRNQFLGYKWACNTCGIPVEDVVIRGVGILKTDIIHVECVKTYSDFLIARWYDQLRRDMWRLVDCWNSGHFDYNLGDACTQYGNCVFMNACASPNADAHLAQFETRRWNPLQKNPTKAETEAR